MRIEYLTGNMVLWSQLRKTISEQIFKLWIRVSTRPEKADILLKFLNLLMNRWIQNRRQLTMNRGNPLMVLGKKIISFPAKHLINYATFQRYSSHFSIGKRARFHSLFFFFFCKWFKSAERKLKWRICNNLCKHRGRPYARNKETH